MSFVRLLRIVSVGACLIVAGWFMLFVVDTTSSASSHQQEVLSGKGPAPRHSTEFGEVLDEAGSALTAPFGGLVSASRSEWGDHGARLLAALLVYGFGLGFVARTIRIRV